MLSLHLESRACLPLPPLAGASGGGGRRQRHVQGTISRYCAAFGLIDILHGASLPLQAAATRTAHLQG